MTRIQENGMGALTGKIALITGAGTKNGLGRAIVLRLARDGADIAMTDMAPALLILA